jgi:photosystem II stability/assembly factor-like uncharacterized protein
MFLGVDCAGSSCLALADASGTDFLVVAGSDDGGASWHRLAARGLDPGDPNTVNLSAPVCPSALDCFTTDVYSGGAVWATTDRGNSWNPVATGLPPVLESSNSLACADTSTCLAAGDDDLLAASSGGRWAVVGRSGLAGSPGPVTSTSAGNVSDVGCVLSDLCYGVSGDNAGGSLATFWTTQDGGQTLVTHPVPGLQYATVFGKGPTRPFLVSCADANHCAALSADLNGVSWTDDGGITWTSRPTPDAVGSLVCSTSTDCIIGGPVTDAGGPTSFWVTNDAGRNWSSAPAGLAAGLSLLPNTCTSGGVCRWVVTAPSSGHVAFYLSQPATLARVVANPPSGA